MTDSYGLSTWAHLTSLFNIKIPLNVCMCVLICSHSCDVCASVPPNDWLTAPALWHADVIARQLPPARDLVFGSHERSDMCNTKKAPSSNRRMRNKCGLYCTDAAKKNKQTGKVPIKAIQCKSLIKLFKDCHMTPSHSFRQREDLLVTGVTNYKSPPSIFRLLPIIPSFKQPILSIEKWRRFWQ